MIPQVYSPLVYAIFRAVTGFMWIFHGLQKIFGMYDGNVGEFPSQRWLGGMLELGLGGMVMIGLLTSVAAFLASGQMAVAYFQSHQPDGALPIENGGELAALYCFAFLFIASYGSGPFSVDALRARKKT